MTSRVEDQGQQVKQVDLPHTLRVFARSNGLQLGIISVFLILWLFFVLAAPQTFLNSQIYSALMSTVPFFALVAIPLTLLVIAGEIDLSFPSIMAFSVAIYLEIFERVDNLVLAMLACLLAGFIAGLLNGLIIVRLGIPSLVATIGTMFFWRGVVLVMTNGQGGSLGAARETLFRDLLVGRLFDYLPAQMIWMIGIAIAMWILLNRHKFGAHIYLIGDNVSSARLMGVGVDRTRMIAFGLVGLAAGFSGVIASLELSYFWPTLGEGYLMKTLAAVFLGGTSVFGGRGTILGTFLGAFIIGAIEPGIVAIGLTGFWTQLIYGLIIILSVAMHALMSRRMA
jgi:simple sugar transport system permease protein